MTDHLKMHSLNKIDENISKIVQLFPNCVTEAKGENGEITHKIDFDMLKQELSNTLVEGREERYQFTWPDKKQAILTANAPINKTLRPCRKESVNFDETENLYIEGDNLEVLKLLQETYLGKIKMIYIDPPYNTGNDFVYNDEFSVSSSEFSERSGNFDEEGNLLVDNYTRNTESNGRFHTDWLNMMYPRLKLARDLLSDDGVIFISIDDNEVENLKKICSEVFGDVNFVSSIVWQKIHSTKNDARYFSENHEYALVYTKNIERFKINLLPRTSEMNDRYKNPDNDFRGPWQSGDLVASGERSNGHYIVKSPKTGKEFDVPQGKHWVYSEENLKQLVASNQIWFGQDGNSFPRKKRFLSEVQDGRTANTLWLSEEVGHNQTATRELKALFDDEKYFDFPKPILYIKQMLNLGTNKDSIVLDFFSGSATTAHAVMQLNAEDGGNRKFIMVQLPEPCDEKSEAYKAGYKNICEIGKERIRRAGKQILELSLENLEKEGVIEKYAGKLSEIRSLEEIYGFSGESLSVGEKTSERGNVCSVGSDEKSGCVDSIEYSGRTSERNQRVHSISENSKGVSCRIGDTTIDLRTLELLNNLGYRIKFESFGGDKQNDLFSDNNSNSKTLSTQLSALKSKLSVLTTLDIGFRVLKCDTSNMEDVYYTPDHLDKQDLFKNNIKSDRTGEDLLFQTMLDLGIMLSSKIETKQIDGKNVYYVEDNYLVACFDEDVTEETITKIAKEKPYYFVMRDPINSKDGDSLITNFEQIFTTYSPETVRKIL